MKTLDEIKTIIYPKEEVDMVEVAKDLITQKYGEGKLVTFGGVFLYYIGDPLLSLIGLTVMNGQLIALTRTIYGGDSGEEILGTVYKGEELSENEGIGVPNRCLLEACQALYENEEVYVHTEFDFTTMKGIRGWVTDTYYLENSLKGNKDFLEILNGKQGYVEL